jgi:hypothetical protein
MADVGMKDAMSVLMVSGLAAVGQALGELCIRMGWAAVGQALGHLCVPMKLEVATAEALPHH